MPLAAPGPQAQQKKVQFSQQQISQLAAYVASLAPGPAVPAAEYATAEGGDPGRGGAIFRVNCAMCHNFAGAGGALTRGKYAPSLQSTSPKHIYEAMITGPQSMPVFNDSQHHPAEQARPHRLPQDGQQRAQRQRVVARQPRPGARGPVRLGRRPRRAHRVRRLARLEGGMRS